jgi:internalin A
VENLSSPADQGHVQRRVAEARRTNATSLTLSGMGIETFPEEICQLTQLVHLKMDGNRLESLPPEIGRLEHLQKLELYGNRLRTLPKEVGMLRSLRSVALSNNQISKLPEEVCALTSLTSVALLRNKLDELPEDIGLLANLETLALSENRLRGLPRSLERLAKLQRLYLRVNQLVTFPAEIEALSQLQVLRLTDNLIPLIPAGIGNLSELREFRIENNRVEALPFEMLQLQNLSRLFLHGNPKLGLSLDILGPTFEQTVGQGRRQTDAKALLDYYFRAQKTGRALNEVKVILVGRGMAGKSSLVKRLVYDKFNPKEKETPGIKITSWSYRCGTYDMRLHLWDFAGQEITHSTHQFFFTNRSVYILVLTGREDSQDRDSDYWLRLIRSFGGDSPIIVALNKSKLHPFDVDRIALRDRHPSIQAFIPTDCKANTGIARLRTLLGKTIASMDSAHALFPGEWMEIKDELSLMKESYLSYTQYQDICSRHGELNVQAQGWLAQHLHALGIALNFSEDPRLRHTTVLNPRWVTNGIYAILRANIKGRDEGELIVADLASILPKEKEAGLST